MSVLGKPIKPKDPVKGFADKCKQTADDYRRSKGQVVDASSPRPDSYKSPTRDSPPIFRLEHDSGLVTLPADCAPDEPEELPDDDLEIELSGDDNIANDPAYRELVHVDAPNLEHILDTVELTDADILASADRKKPLAVRAIKNVLYEEFLAHRSEIGISVEYLTSKKGNPMVRYKHKDEPKPDKWLPTTYVKSAVEALLQYDTHMEKGDWKSLKEAASIVSKYFAKDMKYKTLEMIEQKLDQEAIILADDTIAGLVDKEDIGEVYSRLRKTGLPAYLSKAVRIAERYMGAAVAAVARLEYDTATEHLKKKDPVIERGNNECAA